MGRDDLHSLVRQRPFIPFRIHLRDGRVYELHHPHLLLLGLDWLTVGLPAADDHEPEPFFDTFVSIPLSWIVASEPVDESPLVLVSEGGE